MKMLCWYVIDQNGKHFHRASFPQEELLSLSHYRAGGYSDPSQNPFICAASYPGFLDKAIVGFLDSTLF